MKLRLLCVGKVSEGYLRQGSDDFAGRVRHYLPLTIVEIKEEKPGGKTPDARLIREREGARILEKIAAEDFVIVLDERGSSMGSEELARMLERHMIAGTSQVVLVIGGAHGVSETVRSRGNLVLSLSAMTLTHQMARLFLLEQIYRALTILRNEPYHKR